MDTIFIVFENAMINIADKISVRRQITHAKFVGFTHVKIINVAVGRMVGEPIMMDINQYEATLTNL